MRFCPPSGPVFRTDLLSLPGWLLRAPALRLRTFRQLSVFSALLLFAVSPTELEAQSAGSEPSPMPVPPPVTPLPPLPRPPEPPAARPLSRPDVAEIQRLTPRVEIWRANGQRPQVPMRRRERMEQALVTGTEPATIRLQFNPRAAGERITVIGARGLLLDPPEQVLTVPASGECLVTAQLVQGAPRGHLLVYCKMIKTVVPLSRAPIARVQAEEARTGGRP